MSLLGRLTGRHRTPHAGSGSRAGRVVPGWFELDVPWREQEFVVVDLETTGLHLKNDEIVSYGGVVVRAGRVVAATCVYGLVKPRRPVGRAAVEVHALRLEDLDDAPGLDACAEALIDLLDGRVLVAHAAWVEKAFVSRALATVGARLEGPVVDTAALAREAMLVRERDEGEPALEALAAGLGLPVHTPHHALGDALTTANLFLALVHRLERREMQTVRSLTTASRRHSLR